MFGIEENTTGMQKQQRIRHDLEKAGSILSMIEPAVTEASIRECRRLGKFKNGHSRPLLLELYRTLDVNTILSGRRKLSTRPDIAVKPDLSPHERKVEQLLLKERKKLIQEGTERRAIKLRGSSLYINNRKYGEVKNNTFEMSTQNAAASAEAVVPGQAPMEDHNPATLQLSGFTPTVASTPHATNSNTHSQQLHVKETGLSQ